MNASLQKFMNEIGDVIAERIRRTDTEVRTISTRVAKLEATAKYLSPAAQAGDLVTIEPEVKAARARSEQLSLQLDMARKAIARQNEKAELGEQAIEALRQQVSALTAKSRTMAIDPTIALTRDRKPVAKLTLGKKAHSTRKRSAAPARAKLSKTTKRRALPSKRLRIA